MDGAQRSQSRLDRSLLRAESPRLIGTALYNTIAALAAREIREAKLHGRNEVPPKPYAGWCRTRELITPGDPIGQLFAVHQNRHHAGVIQQQGCGKAVGSAAPEIATSQPL